MAGREDVVVGMPVYGTDGQLLGEVAAVDDDALTVETTRIPWSKVGRVGSWAIHLRAASLAAATRPDAPQQDDQLVVPIVEERLAVGTREVDLGEIEIRKRVVEETVMQPVTVRREVVEVVRRDGDGNEVGAQELIPPGAREHPAR
jgi:hypothetical protein